MRDIFYIRLVPTPPLFSAGEKGTSEPSRMCYQQSLKFLFCGHTFLWKIESCPGHRQKYEERSLLRKIFWRKPKHCSPKAVGAAEAGLCPTCRMKALQKQFSNGVHAGKGDLAGARRKLDVGTKFWQNAKTKNRIRKSNIAWNLGAEPKASASEPFNHRHGTRHHDTRKDDRTDMGRPRQGTDGTDAMAGGHVERRGRYGESSRGAGYNGIPRGPKMPAGRTTRERGSPENRYYRAARPQQTHGMSLGSPPSTYGLDQNQGIYSPGNPLTVNLKDPDHDRKNSLTREPYIRGLDPPMIEHQAGSVLSHQIVLVPHPGVVQSRTTNRPASRIPVPSNAKRYAATNAHVAPRKETVPLLLDGGSGAPPNIRHLTIDFTNVTQPSCVGPRAPPTLDQRESEAVCFQRSSDHDSIKRPFPGQDTRAVPEDVPRRKPTQTHHRHRAEELYAQNRPTICEGTARRAHTATTRRHNGKAKRPRGAVSWCSRLSVYLWQMRLERKRRVVKKPGRRCEETDMAFACRTARQVEMGLC